MFFFAIRIFTSTQYMCVNVLTTKKKKQYTSTQWFERNLFISFFYPNIIWYLYTHTHPRFTWAALNVRRNDVDLFRFWEMKEMEWEGDVFAYNNIYTMYRNDIFFEAFEIRIQFQMKMLILTTYLFTFTSSSKTHMKR